MKQESKKQYGPEQIQQLDSTAHIRRRPSMYIGHPDRRAIQNMVFVALHNAVEESIVERCTQIDLILHKDNSVTIRDNSPGLPVDDDAEKGLSKLEAIMTINALKTDEYIPERKRLTGDIHGIGLVAVNQLSEWMTVMVRRDGHLWQQSYTQGKRIAEVEKVKPLGDGESTGTTLHFKPDAEIFSYVAYDYEIIAHRCQELAHLIAGLRITFRDERSSFTQETTYQARQGLLQLLEELRGEATQVHEPIHAKRTFEITDSAAEAFDIDVELAVQYTDADSTNELGFINTHKTVEGSQHTEGMRFALRQFFNAAWAKFRGGDDANERGLFEHEDIAPGLNAIVSVLHPDPQFSNALQMILGNPEVYEMVVTTATEALLQSDLAQTEALILLSSRFNTNRAIRLSQ